MDQEQEREQAVRSIADMLRRSPFTFEFKVSKRPQGIRVIYEVTQEEMDGLRGPGREGERTGLVHVINIQKQQGLWQQTTEGAGWLGR